MEVRGRYIGRITRRSERGRTSGEKEVNGAVSPTGERWGSQRNKKLGFRGELEAAFQGRQTGEERKDKVVKGGLWGNSIKENRVLGGTEQGAEFPTSERIEEGRLCAVNLREHGEKTTSFVKGYNRWTEEGDWSPIVSKAGGKRKGAHRKRLGGRTIIR